MSPIEMRYRILCERLIEELEAEAKLYEGDPSLHDGDHQFIGSLRDQCHQLRQKLQRMERAYSVRAA